MIVLISESISYDDIGNVIGVDEIERTVYANKHSISNSLQVEAAASDNRIEKAYEIMTADYQDERKAMVNDVFYNVFSVNERGDRTRLLLEKVN